VYAIRVLVSAARLDSSSGLLLLRKKDRAGVVPWVLDEGGGSRRIGVSPGVGGAYFRKFSEGN